MTAKPSIVYPEPACRRASRLQVPTMRGVIERRILINFRCDPGVLARQLPAPFRVQRVGGFGLAGICLIRLREIRPALVPAWLGLTSENAAHRIAVEWTEGEGPRVGVFIPRRDTDSPWNRLAGGRLFPGVHHAADFRVLETDHRCKLEMRSRDGEAFVRVHARRADALPCGSVFASLEDAAAFFRGGATGWSARAEAGRFDGLELRCAGWQMTPLAVERVESSFFGDGRRFPPGSIEFDSAFLMRELPHAWHACGQLRISNGAYEN